LQGFQRLLDIPGYDVATLVEKSGKSASHIYARLSLLQLIPEVADAFTQERITVSHANLIARIPHLHSSIGGASLHHAGRSYRDLACEALG
jgi:ParB family transcriptional regulator, chromosome partitioning protein